MGRGSSPPLAARPGVASQAGAHVVIPRVDCGQPCSARLSELGVRPRRSIPGEGSAQCPELLPLAMILNQPVQGASDVGWGDLRALYSHQEVSAADDWLVTPHHQNCDSKSP